MHYVTVVGVRHCILLKLRETNSMMSVLLMPTASEETVQEFLAGKKFWPHLGSSRKVCSLQRRQNTELAIC